MWRNTVELIVLLTLGVLVVPRAAAAQQPKHMPRIGFLNLRPAPNAWDTAFQQGLHDLGWAGLLSPH